MRPGIVVATAAEACTLVKGSFRAGILIHLPEDSLVSVSGMGAKRARLAAQTLLENGATALVSWGVAGGLLPGLSPGRLILPESIVASDQSVYSVDPIWHERLWKRLKLRFDLHRGTLAESKGVLASCAEKAVLFHRTGAVAVDMESASVALVAQKAGIPLMVIRAIADTAETAIPRSVLDSIDECGRVRLSRIFPCLVKRPGELLALVRLGRNFQVARATLSEVVRLAGSHLLCLQNDLGKSE